MAFEVTAKRNLPNKLVLKQSAQKRPSSIPPQPETASLSLHLMQTLLGFFESASSDLGGCLHVASSSLQQPPDWHPEPLHAIDGDRPHLVRVLRVLNSAIFFLNYDNIIFVIIILFLHHYSGKKRNQKRNLDQVQCNKIIFTNLTQIIHNY